MFVGTALDVFLLWFHLEEEEKRSLFSFYWSACCGWLVYNGLGKTKTEEAVSSCWFNCWSGLLYNKVSLVGRTRGKYVFGQEKQLVK